MKRSKIIAVVVVLLFLSLALQPSPSILKVRADEETVSDTLQAFLNDVIGIDLSTNMFIQGGYGSSYPPKFGGLVEEEIKTGTVGGMNVMAIFDNQQMVFFSTSGSSSRIYTESKSTDVLDQAKNLIERYPAFVSQEYGLNTSHLTTMQSILSKVTSLSPVNITEGNANLEITINNNVTNIQMSYTENGVIASSYKKVQIGFYLDRLDAFIDTWNFYSIGAFSAIKSDEALQLAIESAKEYNPNLFQAKENQKSLLTENLSELRYDITLSMIPGRPSEMDQDDSPSILLPGNTSRNPLALYPLWQTHLYFSKSQGDVVGLQIGVWGDTKEIHYCSVYGFYGNPANQETPTPSFSPTASYSPAQTPMPTPSTNSITPNSPTSPSISSNSQTQNPTETSTETDTSTPNPNEIGIQTENHAFLIFIISLSVLIVALFLVFFKKRKGESS